MKRPTNCFWSRELAESSDTEKGLHILLRFMINVEEKSYDGDFSYSFTENSKSTSKSNQVSQCSTISPETEKVKRLQSQLKEEDDDWSSTLCIPLQSASVRSSVIIRREMPLDCAQSYPILSQSSATSITSFSQTVQGISEQLLHKSQHCANGPKKSSTLTCDSGESYPIIVTQSSASLGSFSQENHGISLLDISQLCANRQTESSSQSGDSENAVANDDSQSVL